MTDIQAISYDTHGDKFLASERSYRFAAKEAVCLVSPAEVPRAILSLPIIFMEYQGLYNLAILLGLETGSNLLVDAQGNWLGGYIPRRYRAYPFLLANSEDGTQKVLCIDEDAQAYSTEDNGKAFYTDGEPSRQLSDALEFLMELERDLQLGNTICEQLNKENLIEQWPLVLKAEDGERKINGLFRVNETKLNELSESSLKELQKTGALLIAYSQLLSMAHIQWFTDALLAKEKSALSALPKELDLEFLNDGDSLNFGN